MRVFTLILVIVSVTSFNCVSHFENRDRDVELATEYTRDFYNQLLSGKYENLALKFAGSTSQDSALAAFIALEEKFGEPSGFMIENIVTQVASNGEENHGTFLVTVKVEYNPHDSDNFHHNYVHDSLWIIWNDTEFYVDKRKVTPE